MVAGGIGRALPNPVMSAVKNSTKKVAATADATRLASTERGNWRILPLVVGAALAPD